MEVGGRGVLTLFVRHVCVAMAWRVGYIPYLNYPLYSLSVQTSPQSAHQFTTSWHAQVLVATGHGIAAGKPSQTVSRMSGFGSDGTERK